jgi:hypothetical protein
MEDEAVHAQTAAITALQATNDQDLRVPYYCEENVWRLTYRKVREQPEDHFFVVIISNSIKSVPMFQQRANSDPSTALCWDYHVILLCARTSQQDVVVYDIDTILPYHSPLQDYLRHSFPYEWPYPYAPMFRLVPAKLYLRCFASDRMHMFNAEEQKWNAPCPSYDCINIREGQKNNLERYLDFTQRSLKDNKSEQTNEAAFGTMLTLKQLADYPDFFTEENVVIN